METLVAVAVLAVIGVTFLSALRTSTESVERYEQRVIAVNLTQSQLEQVKAMPYDATGNYPVVISLPFGYTMSISTEQIDTGKQKVTASVSKDEDFIFKLSTIKTNL